MAERLVKGSVQNNFTKKILGESNKNVKGKKDA